MLPVPEAHRTSAVVRIAAAALLIAVEVRTAVVHAEATRMEVVRTVEAIVAD
jgi:hypothetical protein